MPNICSTRIWQKFDNNGILCGTERRKRWTIWKWDIQSKEIVLSIPSGYFYEIHEKSPDVMTPQSCKEEWNMGI